MSARETRPIQAGWMPMDASPGHLGEAAPGAAARGGGMKARILRVTGWITGSCLAGVLVLWLALTGDPVTVIIWSAVLFLVGAVGLGIVLLVPAGDHHGASDPDAHLEPLQTASPAEKTLVTDLRQRRMLLRPRGLSEHKAAILAAKVTRRTMKLRGLARMRQDAGASETAPKGKHRAERPAEQPPAPLLAAPLAPLPAGLMFAEKTLQREAPAGLPDQPADRLPLHASPAQGRPGDEPEDPHDLCTDEEEADALVGEPSTPVGTSASHSNTEAASVEAEPALDTRCGQCGEDWMKDPECGCRCTREGSAPASELPGSSFRDWERDSIVMQAIKIGTAPGRGEAGELT